MMLSSLLSPNKLQIQHPAQMWVFKTEPEYNPSNSEHDEDTHTKKEETVHLIAVYHNRATSQRYVLLDFQEVPYTKGFSNVLMDDVDRMTLEVPGLLSNKSAGNTSSPEKGPPHFVEIRKVGAMKDGYIGTFDYHCMINSVACRTLKEAVPHFVSWSPLFEVSLQPLVSNTITLADKKPVAWYGIQVIYLRDMSSNTIHRRYSEFSALDDCVRHYFQTQELLPPLPPKSVSFLVDHSDHQFLKARKDGLEQYLICLSKIPFIDHLPEYRRFLGYHSTYKELSYDLRSCSNFEQVFQLAANKKQSSANPYGTGVSNVVNAYVCAELGVGDFLSKINGSDTTGLPYESVVRLLSDTPKPLLLQFIQPLNALQQAAFASLGGGARGVGGGGRTASLVVTPMAVPSAAMERPAYSPGGPGSPSGAAPPAKPPRAGRPGAAASANASVSGVSSPGGSGSGSGNNTPVKTTNTTTAVSKLRIPVSLSSQLALSSSGTGSGSGSSSPRVNDVAPPEPAVSTPPAVPPRPVPSVSALSDGMRGASVSVDGPPPVAPSRPPPGAELHAVESVDNDLAEDDI